MSPELKAFFSKVTQDPSLQQKLYVTKELTDVARIAQDAGFQVTAAELLRAQAGRVLSLPLEELQDLAAGRKAAHGAQWGRGGKGYLDRAGFWLFELQQWGNTHHAVPHSEIVRFLFQATEDKELRIKLLNAKTCDDIALLAEMYGYSISGVDLLRYQAARILELDEQQAENVARGAGSRVS